MSESSFSYVDVYTKEENVNCFREITTRSNKRLALIFGDLQWERSLHNGIDDQDDWKPGGTAWHGASAALQNEFVPIIVSTVGDDNSGNDIIKKLNDPSDGLFGVVTYFVKKKSGETPKYIRIFDGNEKVRYIDPHHINDIEINDIEKPYHQNSVYASSIDLGKDDIIYIFGFQLFRQMFLFELQKKSAEEKNKFIEKYMKSFVLKNNGKRPTIVFDLAPPDLINEHLTLKDLKIVVEGSNIFIANLSTLLKFLKDIKDSEIEVCDIDKDSEENISRINEIIKNYRSKIIDHFLGTDEDSTLIIRFGVKHLSHILILKRLKKKKVSSDFIRKTYDQDENYKITKLGFAEQLMFKYLKGGEEEFERKNK